MGAVSEHEQTGARRVFHWPDTAYTLVKTYLASRPNTPNAIAAMATKLASLTGNPRSACLRFLYRHGAVPARKVRAWTRPEQQRLLNLTETLTVDEISKMLQRSPRSIRSMLYRLGETSQRGRDWFTPYSLAEALHVRAEEVQKWIEKGWLKCRVVETASLKRRIIDPDDFSDFVKQYGPAVIGRRLTADGLRFVQTFVFPPKHAHLLPLRKKEEMAVTPSLDEEGELEESA